MNPRLTIAIPTYNRSRDLQTALKSVFSQEGLPSDRGIIEVLVSDNASTDETQAVLSEWGQHCPWIFSVHRNPQNLGFSGNLQTVFEHAHGDYVFLLSDDDALEPRCLVKVLEGLDGAPGVMIVNGSVRDSELTTVLGDRLYQQFPPSPDNQFKNGEALFRATGWLAFPLVTGHVVRRAAWLACSREAGMSSICMHIFRVLEILGAEPAVALSEPLVQYRTDNAEGRWNKAKGYPFNFQFDVIEAWVSCRARYSPTFYEEYYRALRAAVCSQIRSEKRLRHRIDAFHFIGRVGRAYDLRVLFPFYELLVVLVPSSLYRLFSYLQGNLYQWLRSIKHSMKNN